MLLRRFSDFVLQSRVHAIGVAAVCAFLPLINTVSILIAGLVTLRKGAFEGALVLGAATLPLVIGYFAYSPATPADMMSGAIYLVIACNILTWLFAVLLWQYNNWSFTLELAIGLGVISVMLVHILYPDIQTSWAQYLNQYFSHVEPMQTKAVEIAKRYATGFIAVSVLLNALLQLLFARWWQAVAYNPGGLRKELHAIRLGYVAAIVFIITTALAFLGNALALDVLPVLLLMFCIAGLSLLHYVVMPARFNWVWLLGIYAGMIGLFPISIVIVSVIGLLDTSMNIRKRLV